MYISDLDKASFCSRISIGDSNQCWIYQGGKDYDGYGLFKVMLRSRKAHRVSYNIFHRVDARNLNVLHTCDTPACVNPTHLFVGNATTNNHDIINKKRKVNGENVANHKLSDQQVELIRQEFNPVNNTRKMLAAKYGVSSRLIGLILRYETRKTPTNPLN